MAVCGDFSIKTLGECKYDSPMTNTVFIEEGNDVLVDPTVAGCIACQPNTTPATLERAGSRDKIFFNPSKTRAAIVTCGGLCPGLNDVIRGVTMVLSYRYGVKDILGLRFGYEGLIPSYGHQPIKLDHEEVEDIHKDGGTILGSSRGPQDTPAMVDFLVENEIDILFTIGGDGTQRGALDIADEIEKRNLNISVIGIPKTIDNDVSYTERTFGFETAVAMSNSPITCAHMEAKGVNRGIGLVKLMGRESGFIAAYATLASSDVNLVLVPEVPFTMESLIGYLERRFERKSHAVIVAAEGAGQELVPMNGKDKSGNKVLGDIGLHLKKEISEYFKTKGNPVNIKYIDPSYIIRSAPANPSDSVFCFRLANYAVHAGMSGRTSMVVGFWNGRFVHIPISQAVSERKRIDPTKSLWQNVLDNTGQDI
ncbi:diphosphate--fructose-6-phosphate 1-phosphotransferase [bacterium B17]|nr:diphosphate--fructose-6-phosphate 1-phosphotransferase [bacterium B17]